MHSLDLIKSQQYIEPSMTTIRSYFPEIVNTTLWYYIGYVRCYAQTVMSNTFSANQITDDLFIGNLSSALNKRAMQEQGITHIISVLNGAYEVFPNDFKYKIIHINDDHWVDIEKYFDETVQYIDECLKHNKQSSDSDNFVPNKIMIHCQQGISRSVCLLIAYLLWKENNVNHIEEQMVDETVDRMISFVRERRKIANPNSGFVTSLGNYVRRLNGYAIPPYCSTDCKESNEEVLPETESIIPVEKTESIDPVEKTESINPVEKTEDDN